MVAALPLTFGVFVLAQQLVPFLFDDGYEPAVNALRILVWVVPFMYASEFLGYVVLINGQEHKVARAVAVSTLVNVAVNLMVVPRFGFIGAADVTVLTEAVMVSQYLFIMRQDMRRLTWDKILFRPLLAAALMGVSLAALNIQSLLANVAIGAAIYLGLILLLGVLGKDEIRFVRGLWRRAEAPVG
jgi:O-antigen/teichoic acid export membrane protein